MPMELQPREMRILIVDDSDGNRRLLRAMLHALDLDAQEAADGAAAVAAVETTDYDLVFMDISMPVMDGLSAIRRIREHEKKSGRARSPVFVVSSQDRITDLWASKQAGADGHIPKPVSVSMFLEAIEAGLKHMKRRVRAEERSRRRESQLSAVF